MQQVRAWVENVVIPTYETGMPEKNPIFLEKRVYQGSRGSVYPHPVIESISEEKTDKVWEVVFLENEYLRIMVLPALGGRIQRAYDKIRQRDFVYYNQVIKPALVGLTGPWISGGIEFNWPQHHRPSTYQPVDFSIVDNSDGSKTVWVNEVELMTRTKGMAGFTLYPDKAYLEIKGKLFNRTPFPQTFLWWANPAVKVNDHYQSIFPPDVHAVFDHGKRDVSSFPIAKGTYYKVDYSPGTDISRYKNIPVPTSFMAVESTHDFIGGYEHDTQAGMLHVANHHFSPGKKQWTWGNGDFGQAWDRNLTDEDGPYIELMCGVFTDNQPDFSWLQPNEEKTFEQYFMPYAEIGEVKNATKEAAINCHETVDALEVSVYATAEYKNAELQLIVDNNPIQRTRTDITPAKVFKGRFLLDGSASFNAYEIRVVHEGRTLVSFHKTVQRQKSIPSAASAAPAPADVDTVEKLFLHGLHLEQYRHATYEPLAYYEEALRREPDDIRNNNATGVWYLRRARPEKAEPYLRKAVNSLLLRNPNPSDGEPLYNLGLCLKMQGKTGEAFDFLYKATWNDAWQHNAFLQLARLSARKNDVAQALELIDKSLVRNYHSSVSRHLKAALLRRSGRVEEAAGLLEESIALDPFNIGCLFEKEMLGLKVEYGAVLHTFNSFAEYALDYADAGMYEEAFRLLQHYRPSGAEPMFEYYSGWFRLMSGGIDEAKIHFSRGASALANYCFPSKTEEVTILRAVIEMNQDDARAHYYLGNYWYATGNHQAAIDEWEESVAIDEQFPTAFRNLSLAYYNKLQEPRRALQCMERAFALDNSDARLLMELDLLYKLNNYSHWLRLQFLENHIELVEQRHDLYMERLTLYNLLGDYETAMALIEERNFQPWEGGEGKIVLQFHTCHIELAKQALVEGNAVRALQLLEKLERYPDNLGEGKLPGKPENDVHYWRGIALEMLNKTELAREEFHLAQAGESVPMQAIFYNDPQPENIFYQAKAKQKTGNQEEATRLFSSLVEFGREHLNDSIRIDYFAVSLPELMVFDQDLNNKNSIHCHYVMGLGYLGLSDRKNAAVCFEEVLKRDLNHLGAIIHMNADLL